MTRSRARASARPSARAGRRSRQRGFSLLVVFMLVLVMVGAAGLLISGLQGQFQVAGQDREQQIALYAAEYAVAWAKANLANQPGLWGGNAGWTPLFTTTDATQSSYLCERLAPTNSSAPGTTPKGDNVPVSLYVDPSGNAWSTWRFCYHNNADDPGYLAPQPAGSFTGDDSDANDPMHLLVIEAYGTGPNGAQAHLSVTIGSPASSAGQPTTDYAQVQGGGAHLGSTGAEELGVGVGTSATTSF